MYLEKIKKMKGQYGRSLKERRRAQSLIESLVQARRNVDPQAHGRLREIDHQIRSLSEEVSKLDHELKDLQHAALHAGW